MINLGYEKDLFILPFDHRSTFRKEFEEGQIRDLKKIIYGAFKKSLNVISKDHAAILVDEEYGDEILRDASSQGFSTLLTTEKSGEEEFEFEYGSDFGTHIKKYKPTFAKALVRFDPNNPSEKSKENLRMLSDWCHNNNYKLLIEIIVPDSSSDLIVKTISEFQKENIETDIWKIQGQEAIRDYQEIIEQAKNEWRAGVGVVVLGGGENEEKVKKWIKEAAKVTGIIGFAVGRTVFWEPLLKFRDGKIEREEAENKIAQNFEYFYNLFVNSKI